jgi:hypothetical protein
MSKCLKNELMHLKTCILGPQAKVLVQKHIAMLAMPIRLAPYLQQILDYLEVHGSITQQEYGQIKRSLASRKIDFKTLIKLGLIEVREGGRNTYYCKINAV